MWLFEGLFRDSMHLKLASISRVKSDSSAHKHLENTYLFEVHFPRGPNYLQYTFATLLLYTFSVCILYHVLVFCVIPISLSVL